MDDLLADFLTETNDALEELDNDLVHLEQNPNDTDLLSKIFRLVHTIKGTCGFLGLPKLEKIAHHAENVLGRFREGDLEVTADYVSLIFESIDTIKFILGEIAANGAEPDTDSSALIRKLDRAYESDHTAPEPEAMQEQEPVAEEDAQDMDMNAVNPAATSVATTAAGGASASVATNQSLRVNVDVLEDLMTMVSELVLTRNQLLQILRMQGESDFTAPLQRLNHVVCDLQEGVMKTRMQPIGNAWAKLPRIVRDLSIELGKKVELHMSGQDTELDRQVLELIKDPLTHMVRNSADHGIEDPSTRKAMGKPETGSIRLEACHEGGHILIRIADDGKGLALEKIKRKILDNNLASADELTSMSPQQIQQFIFKAGFSTAEAVTAVSGRGVGMDVVRTNIERIGGTIELYSVEGEGSVFTIKIPLTLAIVSALIVGAQEERFAIPQLAVRELVMAGSNGENRIEHINGAPVFRLRNRLLPLMTLAEVLGIDSISAQRLNAQQGANQSAKDIIHGAEAALCNQIIIVMQAGHTSFGVIVDRVFDTEEIVVKPVSRMLRDIDLFSGNTILGDGSVIMILDPNGLARICGELNAEPIELSGQQETALSEQRDRRQQTALLLFLAGDDAPKAIALSLIDRLENIKMRDIEYADGQRVVQYRGGLMPLVPFSADQDLQGVHEKPVLVFSSDEGRSFGLIADKIIDIREEVLTLKTRSRNAGVLGSTVIDGKATDIIDLSVFYDGALNGFSGPANANDALGGGGGDIDIALLGEADLQALLKDTRSVYPNGAISPEGEAA